MNIPRVLTGLLVILTPLVAAVPQRALASQRSTASFSLDVSAVALDVVVTDARGRFVRGLSPDDFRVLEDGVPQELTFFTSVGHPGHNAGASRQFVECAGEPEERAERREPIH